MRILQVLLIAFSFTLVYSNNLKLSYHEHGTVTKDKMTQFYLPSIPELSNTNKLVFVVFPLSGDCHLFVSTQTNATKTQYNWKSTHTGPNYIVVKKTDRNYHKGHYFVTVSGEWDTNFKVLAYISDHEEIELHDGEPQVAEVEYNQFVKFKFNLMEKKNLFITLANFNGYHRFVIDTVPNPKPVRGKYKWIGYGVANEALTIKTTDRNFIYGKNATYYINVYGYSSGNYKRTEFQVGVKTDGQIDILSEGIPQISQLVTADYQFFEYQISSENDVWIDSESDVWGRSPQLCISTEHKKPTREENQCTWKLENSRTGINSMVINKTDPNWKKSTYYIGVNGWPENWATRSYSFLITAATRLQSKLMLNGKILTMNQKNNEIKWFRFFSPDTTELFYYSATPSKGRVEFYISTDASNMHPDQTNYNYKSWGVTISRYNLRFAGWVYIGVKSFGDSIYTFDIHNVHTFTSIRINRQVNNHVQVNKYHQTRYFYTTLPRRISQPLVIGLTTYTGKGTVYVSKESNPSPEEYIWKSDLTSFYVPQQELIGMNGTRLYFGIRSEDENVLHAHFSLYFPSVSLRLKNNLELQESVRYYQERYYAYYCDHDGRIKIFTRSQYGRTYIYISTVPNPNSMNFKWYYYLRSAGESRTFNIEFPEHETMYYITVLNYYPRDNTLSIKINTDYESLSLGARPIRDDIKKGGRRLYRLWYNDISRFMVSTTLITGRTEMYILKGDSIPSPQNHFGSSLDYPGNVYYLSNTTNEHQRALWTIGIYAKEDSDFYISSQSELGDLELGIPVTGKTKKGDLQYYSVSIQKLETIFVNGFAAEKTCTSLYFSQTEKRPNSQNSKWKIDSFKLYNHHIFYAIQGYEINQNMSKLYIGIEGCEENDDKYHPFEISISHADSGSFLFQEHNKIYADGEYNDLLRNYNFFVTNNNFTKGFHLYIESCTNLPLGLAAMGSSDENATFPITFMNSEFSARSNNDFASAIEIKGNKFANKKLKISLSHLSHIPPANVFSIFSSTEGYDTRPKIHQLTLADLQNEKNEMRKSLLEINATSNYYPLKYSIFIKEALKGLNLMTPCSIRYNQASKIYESTSNGNIFYAKISTHSDKNYWLNVIVTDSLGRENSFEYPMFIPKKKAIPTNFDASFFNFLLQVYRIIVLVLLIVCTEIILYLFIGMLYKRLVYQSKGIEMIPHIDFWRDFPSFIKKGLMVVKNGGKNIKGGYEDLDEPKSSEPNPFEIPSKGTNVEEVYDEI
eukprot:gene3618-6434_t